MRRLMHAAARQPLRVGVAVAVLAVLAAVLALRLTSGSVTDSLVGRSSDTAKATQVSAQRFGEDAVYVLVAGKVSDLVLTEDVETLLGLEGCLAGNPPEGVVPVGGTGGPCGQLARSKPVKAVIGPATFLNESVGQLSDQLTARTAATRKQATEAGNAAFRLARGKGFSLARSRKLRDQAKQLVAASFVRDTLQLALKYGITSAPQLNDPSFISQLVFEAGQAPGTPKPKFAYLFPNATSSLVQVRLKAGLSEGERRRAIKLIRAAANMPKWRLSHGQRYVVTGAPVVVSDVSRSITSSIVVLLGGALLVMALVLAVAFRARRRLAPLAVALVATAIVFGALSAIGSSLTLASVGVVPVLIGLAVDYAIQLQSRFQELPEGTGLVDRADTVARRGAPTVVIAATATAAGFLVLVLSPVPMVRGFGLLLVAGIVIALLVALTLGTALQKGVGEARGIPARAARRVPLRGAARAAGSALRGADELIRSSAAARAVRAGGRRGRDRALLAGGPATRTRAGDRPRPGRRRLGAGHADLSGVRHHQAGAARHRRAGPPGPPALDRDRRAGRCPHPV